MKKTEEILQEVREKEISSNDPQHWEAVERMIRDVQEAEQVYYEKIKRGEGDYGSE